MFHHIFYTSDITLFFQTSPSSVHPPLQLRLAAPEEPGFFLEKIPVRNLKDVWGILEVYRLRYRINRNTDVTLGCEGAMLAERDHLQYSMDP